MRSVITIILGFIIIISSTVLITHRIDTTARVIEDQLKQTETLMEDNQWEESLVSLEQSYSSWTQLHDWWKIFLNHSILNNIEISYKKLEEYIQYHEKGDAMAELNTLMFLLHQVPESETLRFTNIL
ncbi:DUF4363 family protein [Dehalobacter sp. DCM]|uniref:DUF4363 family protein n=1 Tax=Dehalobacter sp. DCM TaxID=2907827 RepID=UPI00308204DB|nr:DUF4363 family protein [Dehalobacter sp. DCM]